MVTETIAPDGFALDEDPTREVTVSATDLDAVIGTQGQNDQGTTDESDFHNRLGSIAWEKRDGSVLPPHPLQGGATFEVSGNGGPFDCHGTDGPIEVVDNGANDADPDAGQVRLNRVCLGSYTIEETVPPLDFLLDTDVTRDVTVTVSDLEATVGTEPLGDPPGTDDEGTRVDGVCTDDACDFHTVGAVSSSARRARTRAPRIRPTCSAARRSASRRTRSAGLASWSSPTMRR